MRPAGSGNMQKNLEVRWPVPANFRKTSEMRPVGSGKTHTNSEMRRPVPAKVREIHSTCPGVFQIDRNLQQIHMRAMSLGLCKKDFVFGVDTVGIFRYRSPTPRRENLHAPLVRTVEKERHSRYLPCAGLSPLSRAEQLWGSPLPGERVRRSVVLTVYVSDLPRLASVCEVLQNRDAFGICPLQVLRSARVVAVQLFCNELGIDFEDARLRVAPPCPLQRLVNAVILCYVVRGV